MDTVTKCDICGLNITMSSKLLEASQYDKIISTMNLLKNTGQLPVYFKSYRNKDLGDSVNYCAIAHKSYRSEAKCKHWQLNSGQNASDYISIHQSKTNLFLAKVAIGVSFASLVVALMSMGQSQSTTKTAATKDNPFRVEKESPKNPPNKTTNPVFTYTIKIEKVEEKKLSPEKPSRLDMH